MFAPGGRGCGCVKKVKEERGEEGKGSGLKTCVVERVSVGGNQSCGRIERLCLRERGGHWSQIT